MPKTKSKLARRRDQIAKIVVEVIVGIAFTILAGYLITIIITKFLPQYKSYESFVIEAVHAVTIFLYSPFFNAVISMGPRSSSGSVNFVSK